MRQRIQSELFQLLKEFTGLPVWHSIIIMTRIPHETKPRAVVRRKQLSGRLIMSENDYTIEVHTYTRI